MELKDIRSGERLWKFRESYRDQIDGWYNGFLHVFIIYSIGFLLMFYYISHLNGILLLELLVVPITFIPKPLLILLYDCGDNPWWVFIK